MCKSVFRSRSTFVALSREKKFCPGIAIFNDNFSYQGRSKNLAIRAVKSLRLQLTNTAFDDQTMNNML
jgi:hypothetical protein